MRVLFSASDLGGAEFLNPVIRKLSQQKNTIKILSEGEAFAYFQTRQKEYLGDDIKGSLYDWVLDFSPEVAVIGTGFKKTIEKKLTLILKRFGIPTVSVIDYWSNYKKRFISGTTECFTNYFFVIDEIMKNDMILEGFKPDRLIVTGNPSYKTPEGPYRKIKKSQILYVSQPFSELRKIGLYTGRLDEFLVLRDLILVISELNRETESEYFLNVRLHPQESPDKYRAYLNHGDCITVQNDFNKELYDSIQESKVIVGMHSTLLWRAYLYGKNVYSYQPGILDSEDLSILNRLGIKKTIDNRHQLKKIFRKIFKNEKMKDLFQEKMIRHYTDNGSTENIIRNIRFLTQGKQITV